MFIFPHSAPFAARSALISPAISYRSLLKSWMFLLRFRVEARAKGQWSRRCMSNDRSQNRRRKLLRKRHGPVTICALATENYTLILGYFNFWSIEDRTIDARPPRPHSLLDQQIKVKLLISLTQLPLQEHCVVFSVSVKRKKKKMRDEKYRSFNLRGEIYIVNEMERAFRWTRPCRGGFIVRVVDGSRIVLQWNT